MGYIISEIKNRFFKKIRISYSRWKVSYRYDKNSFNLKSISNIFVDIYNNNLWDSQESKSGFGSTLDGTCTIREQLPILIAKYKIKTLLDVPCGDYNWMKEVKKDCSYIGGDIVEEVIHRNQQLYSTEKIQFKHIDITKDPLQKVDLIFCKDCLQHLSHDKIVDALTNFVKSGSKYLLVTSYPLTWRNHNIYDGDYRPLNLLIKPYYLTNYILKIKEESKLNFIEAISAIKESIIK